MHVVGATFTDHDEVERTVQTLAGVGVLETKVIALADVDMPYAEPVLLAVRVEDGSEGPVREILRRHGGSLLADGLPAEMARTPTAVAEPEE